MSRAISKRPIRGAASDYLALCKRFPLCPIRNEAEYDRAAEVLDRLVTRTDLTPGEADYMETLTLLVGAYDDEHNNPEPDRDLTPVDMLRFLMEQHSMSTTGLGELLGSKGVASEVLHGKRGLSKAHIMKLAERFAVDPAIFLDRPRTLGKARTSSRPARPRVVSPASTPD